MNARVDVYVMGLITYTDDLENQRETVFCRKLNRHLKRLLPVAHQDYEYAD